MVMVVEGRLIFFIGPLKAFRLVHTALIGYWPRALESKMGKSVSGAPEQCI